MGRKKQKNGRRNLVGARVSEATLAALDEARGAMTRSEAVAAAIDAWVAAEPWGQSYPARTAAGIDIVVDKRLPEGTVVLGPVRAENVAAAPGGTRTRKLRSQAFADGAPSPGHTAPDSATAPGAASGDPKPARQARRRCPHPGLARNAGGYCPGCDVVLRPGGYLPD